MQNNLISIITPMYNAERFVAQTIESVRAQTYPHWEMLIVDDGSRDNSPSIAEQYAAADTRIRLLRQANAGSAAARNNALRQAQGRYIVLLDADDILLPHFMHTQLDFMRNRNAALVFASYQRIDEQGRECMPPFIVPPTATYRSILKSCPISCLTAMYDSARTGIHYFPEQLRSMRDDYVMWLAMLKKIDCAFGNQAVLAQYRISQQSATGSKRRVILPQFRVYYSIEKLGLLRSIYYLAHWAVRGYFKYRQRH